MNIFKQLYRYGDLANTHDLLKAIATITMIMDHVGLYLMDNNLWMRDVGRIAAPLFFFVVGTVKSFRFRWDLLIYGALLTLITFYTEHLLYLNILINFIFIKWVLNRYNPKHTPSSLLIFLFVALFILQIYLHPWLEYGSFGLLFAFAGRLISQGDQRGRYWVVATLILYFLTEAYYFNFFIDLKYMILLALEMILLNLIMINFKSRTWLMPRIFNETTLFLSRYSLQIYFFHLAGLKLWVWLNKQFFWAYKRY